MNSDEALAQAIKALELAKEFIGEQQRGRVSTLVIEELDRGVSAVCALHRLANGVK